LPLTGVMRTAWAPGAVGAGVGGVEHGHDRQVHLAAAQRRPSSSSTVVSGGSGRPAPRGRRRTPSRPPAEDERVVGVGGHALEPVEQQLFQAGQIGPRSSSMRLDPGPRPGGSARRGPRRASSRPVPGQHLGRNAGLRAGVAYTSRARFRMSAARRSRASRRSGSKLTLVTVVNSASTTRMSTSRSRAPSFAGAVRVLRDPLGGQDQQILQRRGVGILPAHAERGAPGPLRRLLALVTKHAHDHRSFVSAHHPCPDALPVHTHETTPGAPRAD
jgi:hypothetical protein